VAGEGGEKGLGGSDEREGEIGAKIKDGEEDVGDDRDAARESGGEMKETDEAERGDGGEGCGVEGEGVVAQVGEVVMSWRRISVRVKVRV
jgi:hypothetical protein